MRSPQHCAELLRHRLQGYDLPLIAVEELVDAFLLASNELLLSLQELCQPLEEDDPARLELIAYYESQVDGWANESIDKVEAWLKPPPPTPPSGSDSLARAHRPYLEEYLKTNAYPSTADKKTLAECEGISVRQVHVWFQNRRARARECGLSLPYVPRASTSQTHTRYASMDSGDKRWWDVAGDDGRGGLSSSLDKPSRRHSPYVLPAASRATRAPLKSHFDGRSRSSRSSRHRKRTRVPDVEELPAAFCAMNVRQPGHDEASAKGYAACDAITYVLPKAPLPSLVPTAPYVDPNVVSTSYSVRAQGNGRRPSGSPRRTESSRPRDSWGLPERVSSASPPSRKPSLTFSDTSSASSSGPESPPELRPSSVSDSASPISTTTCSSSLPQTNGRNHDDVRLCEEYQPYPLSPPDANTSVSLAEPYTPFDQFSSGSNNPYLLQSSIGLQSPALFTTTLEIPADLCAAGDSNVLAQLFGEGSTATMKDGVITFPNLDEYTFPDLDIDPNAPAGPVDIQPVSWDLDLGSLANLAPKTSQGWDATTGALGWSSDGTWYPEPRNWLGDVAAAAMPVFATSWTPAACVAAF